jgi:hypothetical protein
MFGVCVRVVGRGHHFQQIHLDEPAVMPKNVLGLPADAYADLLQLFAQTLHPYWAVRVVFGAWAAVCQKIVHQCFRQGLRAVLFYFAQKIEQAKADLVLRQGSIGVTHQTQADGFSDALETPGLVVDFVQFGVVAEAKAHLFERGGQFVAGDEGADLGEEGLDSVHLWCRWLAA